MRVKKLRFPFRKWRDFEIPTGYEDLTEAQFLRLPDFRNGSMSNIEALNVFFGIDFDVLSSLSKWEIFSLVCSLNFLNYCLPLKKFIINKCFHLEAPKPGLADILFSNFVEGEIFYKLNDKFSLTYLMACYYDNRKFDLFRFVKENKNFFEASSSFSENNMNILRAVKINYSCIRLGLSMEYPYIFRLIDSVQREGCISMKWSDFLDPAKFISDFRISERGNMTMHSVLQRLNNRILVKNISDGKRVLTWRYMNDFDLAEN